MSSTGSGKMGATKSSSPEPSPASSSGSSDSTSSNRSLSDGDSTLYDHDLSTYATLKTDEMSFEQLESCADENGFELDDIGEPDDANDAESESPPEPKFEPLQKVYARDKDGVMYAAVVRRRLFGPQYHKQIEMGLVTSQEEADEMLKEDHEPIWNYFIHYNNWNVSFDRWVPEASVFEITDEVKAFSERLLKEHRALQQEMKKSGVKGKKQWQTIDGAAFLLEWKKRMNKVEREMKFGKYGDYTESDENGEPMDVDDETDKKVSPKKAATKTKDSAWTKAALALERKLRMKSLTSKRPQSQVGTIVLPLALKKILVEQWEIIQCGMMPNLPAPTTIRQALNQYLQSKNVPLNLSSAQSDAVANGETTTKDGVANNSTDGAAAKVDSGEPEQKKVEATSPEKSPITNGKTSNAALKSNNVSSKSPTTAKPKDEETLEREQEWRDMADGIAMLFDEVLETSLLYREEKPQLRVLDDIPELSTLPYSEMYGCEYLLRLCIRLPDMLSDSLSEAEVRPIIAKVNDLVRFLHKNHGTLLTQPHRKLNEAELKEQQKILKNEERKRKLREATQVEKVDPGGKKIRAGEK